MRREHDVGVLPLGRPVVAGNQAHSVQPTEVAEYEGIARLGLIGRTVGECKVPGRVLAPTVILEERILLGRTRLDVPPPAAYPVPLGVDQLSGLGDTPLVHSIDGHGRDRADGSPLRVSAADDFEVVVPVHVVV